MLGMPGLAGVTGHRAYSAGTLLLAVGGLVLYQMTSLVLGPGGSRQLHLSLSVPGADTDERNESWAPSLTLALGTLAGPAHPTSPPGRAGVAPRAGATPARPGAPPPPRKPPPPPPRSPPPRP